MYQPFISLFLFYYYYFIIFFFALEVINVMCWEKKQTNKQNFSIDIIPQNA